MNMNTKEQTINLYTKIGRLIDSKKGILTLTFFDNSVLDVRFISMNSETLSLKIFITNIKDTTEYDIYEIKDVN